MSTTADRITSAVLRQTARQSIPIGKDAVTMLADQQDEMLDAMQAFVSAWDRHPEAHVSLSVGSEVGRIRDLLVAHGRDA